MADLNSRNFQIQLVHDLINNSPNVRDFKVIDQSIPAVRDVDIQGSHGSLDDVYCDLSFVYNYQGQQIPLHLGFNGTLYFDVNQVPKIGDGYSTPHQGGLEISNNDYSAIEISLMTPEGEVIESADWINKTNKIADKLGERVLDKYITDLEYEG